METGFTRDQITPDLFQDALNFFTQLSNATLSNPQGALGQSTLVLYNLKQSFPLEFKHLDSNLIQRLTPQNQEVFHFLQKKIDIFRNHLQKLRSLDEILALPATGASNLLESLYVNVIYRAHVAFYSTIARLGGVSKQELKTYCPQDVDFIDIDWNQLGFDLQESHSAEIVKAAVAHALADEDVTLILALLNTVIADMLNNRDNLFHYAPLLQERRYSIVKLNGLAPESRLLKEAQKVLTQLLNTNFASINRLLKYYELLDLHEKDLENIPTTFLQGDPLLNKEKIISHIKTLFPKKIVVIRLRKSWGCTLVDGNICLSPDILTPYESPQKIVQIVFTLLHEFGHLKKYFFTARSNYLYKTPEAMKSHTKVFGSGTTRTILEKDAFEGKIDIEKISHEIANTLITGLSQGTLTEAMWQQIEDELKIEPPKEEKLNKAGCQNESNVKSFSMCKSFSQYNNLN